MRPREICPRMEGPPVGQQENRVRPSRMALLQLGRSDVDLIEIRPLLAVDLDRDEVGVQDLRHRFVVEALLLHHMAPVAGRIADREEDRPVERRRLGQRLGAPGAPIDRIMGVLDQIGRGLQDQPIDIARGPIGVQQLGARDVIGPARRVRLLQPLGQRSIAGHRGRIAGADAAGIAFGGHGNPSRCGQGDECGSEHGSQGRQRRLLRFIPANHNLPPNLASVPPLTI